MLWLSLTGVVALQLIAINWPPAQRLFGTTQLTFGEWSLAVAVSSLVLVLEETRKALGRVTSAIRHRMRSASLPAAARIPHHRGQKQAGGATALEPEHADHPLTLRRRVISGIGRTMRWADTALPRGLRSLLGALLIVAGLFGILPVLGFWVIPAGGALVALDISPLRRRVIGWLDRHGFPAGPH